MGSALHSTPTIELPKGRLEALNAVVERQRRAILEEKRGYIPWRCTMLSFIYAQIACDFFHVAGENPLDKRRPHGPGLRQVGVCFGHSLRHGRYFVRLSALLGAVQLLPADSSRASRSSHRAAR